MSALADIVAFHLRPRFVARKRLTETVSEGQAFCYLILACLLLFFIQLPEMLCFVANGESHLPFDAVASAQLIGALVFAPLFFYFLSAVAGLAIRVTNRRLAWRDSRVALFWALLASVPSMMVLGLVRVLTQSAIILWPLSALTGMIFLLFWASGLREAISGRS